MGHPGKDRTLSLLQDQFYWPGMYKDTASWIEQCGRCLRRKVIKELLSTYRYEEIKNHQLSSYGEWHVRKIQQNTIEYALVVGITPKTELESLLRFNDPFIQQYKA
jgi:hypothetical protein